MAPETGITLQDLEYAVTRWEDSIEWIRKGWDDIDEYTHDLGFRENLDDVLEEYSKKDAVPQELLQRIAAADDLFRSVTEPSRLCVWHCGPQFRAYPDGNVELLLEPYDPDQYWYYYRWQPDCPFLWRGHDAISYQREVYGLDFEKMSESELKDAVLRIVKRWEEQRAARKVERGEKDE